MSKLAWIVSITLLSTSAAFAEVEAIGPQEQQCQQHIENYLSLNRAPNKVAISGQTEVGLAPIELDSIIETQGYCAAWQVLVEDMMKQHGQILDSVEEMTGQPAPKR